MPHTQANLSGSNKAELAVNQTAYRILNLLGWLQNSPLSLDDMKARLQQDAASGGQAPSNDTLWMYLNTLRQLGCEINPVKAEAPSRPAKAGLPTSGRLKRFQLHHHPFCFRLAAPEVQLLLQARQYAEKQLTGEHLLQVDAFLNRLLVASQPRETPTQNALRCVNYEPQAQMLHTLQQALKTPKDCFLQILYGRSLNPNAYFNKRPSQPETELWMLPQRLQYRSGALYLAGYVPQYDGLSFLRVDEIKRLKHFGADEASPLSPAIRAALLCKKQQRTSMQLRVWYCTVEEWQALSARVGITLPDTPHDETVTPLELPEGNAIEVVSDSPDRFSLKQRLLALGKPFRIMAPSGFATEMRQTLLAMQRQYSSHTIA